MNRSLLNTEAAIQNLHHIANADQPSIPANVLERITQASENRVSENISALPAAYDIKEYLQAAAPNDSDSIEVPATRSSETLKMEAYDRKLRSGELFARRRIDGIKENQRQIAKQLSSIRSDGHDKSQERLADKVATVPTSTLDKVRTRLSELEQISKDINKNIDHIDAVVAIKDNYLHQLRTAETLLARYNAAQTSGDDDQMDQAEIFHAAYTVIMHNVPRRYNPEASNKDGHETIAQVIARLEDEVSDLNSKAAEERFEVGLEMALLNEIMVDPNIDTEVLSDKANQAVDRYVKTMRRADAKAIDVQRELDIKKEALIRIRKNIFPLEANPVADSGMIKSGMPYEYRFSNLERLSENANGGVFEESGAPSKVRVDEVDKLTKSGYVEVIVPENATIKSAPTGRTEKRAVNDFGDLRDLLASSHDAPERKDASVNHGSNKPVSPDKKIGEWNMDNF